VIADISANIHKRMLIGTLARSLHRYLFDPIEKKGTTFLLNRLEFLLTTVLTLALMTAMAYFSGPWDPHNRYRYLAVAVIIIEFLRSQGIAESCWE